MELFFRLHALLYRVLRENSSPSMEVARSRQYTEARGHPTHTLTSGLSPFPEKKNCHVDHDHYYYDLNQKPNRHFTTSLTPPNCPTDPSSGQQAGCSEHVVKNPSRILDSCCDGDITRYRVRPRDRKMSIKAGLRMLSTQLVGTLKSVQF